MGYLFDDIEIAGVAIIARPIGPIETGAFGPLHAWVPDANVREIIVVEGFGIRATDGTPYYSSSPVLESERARLMIDPENGRIMLRQ